MKNAPRHGARALWAAGFLLFACAVLSKTVACTLPAALLVLIWWKRGRIRRWELARLAPFFGLGAGLGLLTVFMERSLGATGAA